MPQTKTPPKPKNRHESVFPDRASFEVFLDLVQEAARGTGVKPGNIHLILEDLTEKFGQGLPEEEP